MGSCCSSNKVVKETYDYCDGGVYTGDLMNGLPVSNIVINPSKVKVKLVGKLVVFLKDYFRRAKKMEEEYLDGLTVLIMMETLQMRSWMVMENIIGQMAKSTRVIGLMEI